MTEQRTARVVLLDAQDRVLLMEIPSSGGSGERDRTSPSLWVTLGGRVEPSESVLDAARRELLEETGFDNASIVRPVWHGRQNLVDAVGERLLNETFVLARIAEPRAEWSSKGWTPEEQDVVRSLRWWSIDELEEKRDQIKPPGLAGLLRDLLADDDPAVREIELQPAP